MRRLVFIASVIILFCGMGTKAFGFQTLPTDTLHLKEPAEEQGDSLEYELVIFDPAFETWFIRNRQPEGMYSQAYLENWNQQLVTQWNALLGQRGRGGCMPETYLNYEPGTDYGKTLNYQLFYYFRYMQEKCRIFSSFPRRW
ncbi:MAG: DUF6146 family protein [Bacteroidales bacterium]